MLKLIYKIIICIFIVKSYILLSYSSHDELPKQSLRFFYSDIDYLALLCTT